MESANAETPCCAIESDANKIYFAVFCEFLAYTVVVIPISLTVDFSNLDVMSDGMPIMALIFIILRIIVAILVLIGNKIENLPLLWLGVVGQIVTIGLNIVWALMALLILGNVLLSIIILFKFSMFPLYMMAIVGTRIEKIDNGAEDPDANTA